LRSASSSSISPSDLSSKNGTPFFSSARFLLQAAELFGIENLAAVEFFLGFFDFVGQVVDFPLGGFLLSGQGFQVFQFLGQFGFGFEDKLASPICADTFFCA